MKKPHPLANRNFRDEKGNSLVLMGWGPKMQGVQYLQFFNGGKMAIEVHTVGYLDQLKLVPKSKTDRERKKRQKKEKK